MKTMIFKYYIIALFTAYVTAFTEVGTGVVLLDANAVVSNGVDNDHCTTITVGRLVSSTYVKISRLILFGQGLIRLS